MKFAFLPSPWEASVADLQAAGHEMVDLDQDPDMLVFRGGPKDFPDTLPESVKVVQIGYAGIEMLLDAGILAKHAARGIRFANAAGVYDDTVAESTLGLLLAVSHRHKAVRREWNQSQLFDETEFLFDNKKLALIGAGGIGKKLIEFLAPFGVEVTAVNRSGREVKGAVQTVAMSDAEAMAQVWANNEYFVLLAPLTPDTKHLVNAEVLAAMPSNAVIVNVGRGGLIDTEALTDALRNGTIAGAGLDVTEPEPLPADHPLWDMDAVVITPHTANTPRFMERRVGALAAKNWDKFASGEQMHTEVDVDAGY
ncbi:D-isomer specific 2-hydroxyacid dehydrogenase family protein [Corynebacterium sp. HMSC071B10]|uniref:D-isomer specific 2-hydroxyacid dehydrogenase family protein n=1 Tax=Corynebacterium sp. HMSC071B10 TaxID=1739494 RepID=UPI0008A53F01|nr:D-isomer specific 2-hydroxyacid dehydrogenase family protein [Corynebacterium sp. HMSC071B10]OFP34573.1 hypothetical protein HMPREF2990_00490 [Corynebacterium sp. HMSC071B10]